MYSRQRINQMQAGRQRFIAYLAEQSNDPNMSGPGLRELSEPTQTGER
jgi:hypothetical protein